jgi:hypothetical protein
MEIFQSSFSLSEKDGDLNRLLPSYGITPNTIPYFPHRGVSGHLWYNSRIMGPISAAFSGILGHQDDQDFKHLPLENSSGSPPMHTITDQLPA